MPHSVPRMTFVCIEGACYLKSKTYIQYCVAFITFDNFCISSTTDTEKTCSWITIEAKHFETFFFFNGPLRKMLKETDHPSFDSP